MGPPPQPQRLERLRSTLFTCGFTGHEHIGGYGLINMNGRVYDPRLGRFMSPDPYVQAPDFSQSFNRYSYVWNNPLKYVDPDGEWVLPVIGFLIGAYIGGVASNEGELNPRNWDFKNSDTWLAMGFGGIMGAAFGYWVANPTAFTLNIGASTPYLQAGIGITGVSVATGGGTDWRYNFTWTTTLGGYGEIDLSKPFSVGDLIAGSNVTSSFYTGGYIDTSPEYDPIMAYRLGGVWLPEIIVRWNGVYGSGRVRGGSPYWWGYTSQMANPITQARIMGYGAEVMYVTLALPVAIIGAGETLGYLAYNGYSVALWNYPNAGGRGLNFLKDGKRIIGFDWHRFKYGGRWVNRPHLDIPFFKLRHWPWN